MDTSVVPGTVPGEDESLVMSQTPRPDAASAFEESAMTLPIQPLILSPCTGVCQLGRDGYCDGCLRSGDEIARWIAMGEGERRHLVDDVLPGRETLRRCR